MSKALYLNNPYGGEPAVFNVITKVSDEANEIIQTIKYLSEDFTELADILSSYLKISKRFDKFYENLKTLCESFNEWTVKNQEQIRSKNLNVDPISLRASSKLAKFILHLIYNRAVLDPDKLNHYEPFSPQVYGETSFDLIEKMLKRVKLKENDIFMDLGSGVGNVVLQVAAVSKCKRCYGFEKAEWPARYAVRMEKEFKYWMHFFGKTYSEFRLYRGDFLSQEEYLEVDSETDSHKRKVTTGNYVKELIDQSNLIFVNNFAFGAEVDHQLKLRFLDMLEGAFIVSSKPFCSLNFRINDRNLNDFGAILNLNAHEPLNGHVSWTDKPIHYYFQKIDRTLLEKYYESKMKPVSKNKDQEDHGERPSRSKNRTTESPNSQRSAHSSDSSSSSMSSLSSNADLSESPNDLIHSKKSKIQRSNSKENKKRKQSVATNENGSKLHDKKKSRLMKEVKKERKRSKSLDKEEKRTLEKMHLHVSKVTKTNKDDKISNSSPIQKLNNSIKETKDNALKDKFNQKTMTKLTNENLDTKLLKDTKISSKLVKHLNSTNKNSINKTQNETSTKNEDNIKLDFDLNNIDEEKARLELGDDLMNTLDNYFKITRQQYIKYLLYMKSSQYKEKLDLEFQKEKNLKAELLNKTEELENQKKELLKQNIVLLKQHANQLGISDLKTTSQLIQCAKESLEKHKELEAKINSLLDATPTKKNGTTNHEKLSQILSKIEPTTENYSKNSDQKIDDTDKNVSNQINDAKSVSSRSNSIDETLTATERADEEDDDSNPAEPIQNENENNNKNFGKLIRPHSNPNTSIQAASQKSIMDKIFHNNDRTESLKSFKIPKQSRKESVNSNNDEKSISPGVFSNSSSNSAFETNISKKHNRNLSGDFNLEFSSSSSPSPSQIQTESKSYSNYYHPKKKYMMENSSTKTIFKEDSSSQESTGAFKTTKNENFESYRSGNSTSFSTQSSSQSSQSIPSSQTDLNSQFNPTTTSYPFYNS